MLVAAIVFYWSLKQSTLLGQHVLIVFPSIPHELCFAALHAMVTGERRSLSQVLSHVGQES